MPESKTSGPGAELAGHVVIVTGAARGIGRATALAFARAGADLALVDIDESGVGQLAKSLARDGVRAEAFAGDLARVADIRTIFSRVVESYGRLDALANVAAIYPMAHTLDVTEEHWDAIHALDLRGVFFCCQEAMRIMFDQGSGAIVNVCSGSAYRSVQPNAVAYSAAKAGIIGMSRSLAFEGARRGLRVNIVSPGMTESDGIVDLTSPEDRLMYAEHMVPGRLIQPEEVAAAIVFLCTDAASGMNGATLHVTGGDYMP